MLGSESMRNETGVAGLVGRLVEAEAERLDGAARGAPQHGHDGARVDAARQRDADRHVRDELALDGLLVVEPDALEPVAAAQAGVGGPVDVRVPLEPGLPCGELEHVARWQAGDAAEERPVAGDVADVHRQVQAQLVDLGLDEAAREHRLGLGPERQLAALDRVHERLHPERVPGQEQLAAGPVIQGEGEDPVQPGGEADPLVLVQVGQDLGVAVGAQLVAAVHHQVAELGVVVDLAVVDDDHRAVLVGHRLRAAGHVLDGQPPVAEVDAVAAVETLTVGPAVGDRVGHGPDELFVPEARRARYPAHRGYRSRPAAAGRPVSSVIVSPRRRTRSSPSSTR